MSYRDWHVGMKVVCVDDSFPPVAAYCIAKGCVMPIEGKIYTIREIGPRLLDGDEIIFIRLLELINPKISVPNHPFGEPAFGARRFRPVQRRKADISIFTAMLTDARHKVDA